MKTNRSLFGGKLREAYYASYATLFVRYLQAYAAHGLSVDFVTVQNEPHYEPATYPGMRMEAEEQAAFIRDHLGPAFRANGIGTRILAWDHNWNEPGYALTVLGDAGARAFVAGTAFHCYAGDVRPSSWTCGAPTPTGDLFHGVYGREFASFADDLRWMTRNLLIGAIRKAHAASCCGTSRSTRTTGPRTEGAPTAAVWSR